MIRTSLFTGRKIKLKYDKSNMFETSSIKSSFFDLLRNDYENIIMEMKKVQIDDANETTKYEYNLALAHLNQYESVNSIIYNIESSRFFEMGNQNWKLYEKYSAMHFFGYLITSDDERIKYELEKYMFIKCDYSNGTSEQMGINDKIEDKVIGITLYIKEHIIIREDPQARELFQMLQNKDIGVAPVEDADEIRLQREIASLDEEFGDVDLSDQGPAPQEEIQQPENNNQAANEENTAENNNLEHLDSKKRMPSQQASYNVENDEQEDEEEEATEALNSQDDQQQVEVQEAPVAQQKPIVMTIAAPQQATPAKKAVVAEEEDEEFVEKEDDEEDYQQEDEDEEDDDEDFVEEKVEKPTRATKNSNKKASKKAAKKTPVKTRKDDKPVAASSSVVAASSAHQQEGPIQVTIKPARKTRSNFISFFPEKLYCAPYKYDVRVRFSASESHEKYNNMIESGDYQTLLFKLLDGETHKPIKSNSKGDKALTVEKCKKSDLMNEEGEDHDDQAHHANEVVYRLCFNVCSFHNHRKPFVIQCTEKNSELLLFESNPFHIYARKNNKDKNGSDQWGDEVPAESVKTLFSGLENEEQTAGSEDAMDSKEEDNEKTVTASKRSREEDGNSDEKKSSKKKQKTLRIQLPAQFQKQAGEFSNVE